jgi:hypothetical protein
MAETAKDLLAQVWAATGGPAELIGTVHAQGPDTVLPSVFDVTGLAAATVSAATLAAAEVLAVRTTQPIRPVSVDRRSASAAFLSEALFAPVGWDRPPVWDPIAGNYRSATGWIRLHTNYSYHRDAVERVLAVADKPGVSTAVAGWEGDELETAVVDAGGCAAVMHDHAHWLRTPPGQATAREPLVARETRPVDASLPALSPGAGRPYDGVRVLDLTRVIAGPVCTRVLAGYGAEVLRIDPPGFSEVPALLPDTTTGKRTAALDLTNAGDREVFESLLGNAHVLVTGLRSGALERLGYAAAALRALNPALITASLDAYGWHGPWRDRRGFDSLVQMSCGIAAAGASAVGSDAPVPLPAQALDHGTGYLLAAAVGRALTALHTAGVATDVHCSLIATANLLMQHSASTPIGDTPAPGWTESDTVATSTGWGPARRVPLPGSIDGIPNDWVIDAGPLGRSSPSW